MSMLKRFTPLLILAGGFATAFVIANGKPAPEPKAVAAAAVPSVDILSLQPQTSIITLQSEGTLTAKRDIDLVAEVSGRIVSVMPAFADGASVSAETMLLQIDPADYETEVVRAKARLADAEQALALEKGRARQAKREWRDLGSREANDLFLRKPQLKAMEAAVAAAEADLRKAELNLQRTRIHAPFNGRLYNLQANLGQYVSPGTPVASIFDASVGEIALPLSERQLRLLALPLAADGPVDVEVKAHFGNKTLTRQASLVRSGARLDSDTRQLAAMVEIDQPFSGPDALLAGQFVEVSLPSKALDNVAIIPQAALHPRDTLWLLDEDNRLTIQQVEVLQASGDKVAIQLPDDQPLRLVTSYLANPVPGMALLPRLPQSAQTASQQL
ncbi:RND family efflux transporter MFP subunit [Litorivivens lipolytica]|uniref:RND family efflux transporter MFP subunit n=1 Tax=Litorivivens lipolytica TaxID=1524264 RepID=A0A7W4W5P2_9GAMM|nr:efflux RND transporter periplasmic adaptor subunit [Litorivivens lipolytica]MBB3047948.1 RND family efflux transporter MFP subunit [Litorivivens lipolytica]